MYPADWRRSAIDAAVVPLPMPEISPPETKIYFLCFVVGTIIYIKNWMQRQDVAPILIGIYSFFSAKGNVAFIISACFLGLGIESK